MFGLASPRITGEVLMRRRAMAFGLAALSLTACQTLRHRKPSAPQEAMIDRPLHPGEKSWVHLPRADEAFALYPEKAKLHGIQGQVQLRCRVRPTGVLTGCAVIDEAPKGHQFGAATLRLVKLFQLEPGLYGRKVSLEVPITWKLRHEPTKADEAVPPPIPPP